jgi:hypothetical protein
MPNLKVSDAELKGILHELETDLSKYLKDTQSAKLSKAREEDGSPSPGFGGSPSAGGDPSASVAPSASPGAAAPDASPMGASPEGAPPEGSEMPPEEGEGEMPPEEGAAPEGDPAGEQGIDPQALEAEYAQLPVEELKAHYLAAKSALFQKMGQGQPGAGAPQGAPPPAAGPAGAPPAGPPAGPPEGAPPAFKAEMPSEGNGGFNKSEADDLRAQLAAMAKVVNLLAGSPVQKAVTGLTYMGKSEPVEDKVVLSQQEVTAKLNVLTRDPSLKKSDRERITGYYEGTVNVSAIADLLK